MPIAARGTCISTRYLTPFAIKTSFTLTFELSRSLPFLDWLRKHGLGFFVEASLIPDIPMADRPAVGTMLGCAIRNHAPLRGNDLRPSKLRP